MNEQNNISGQKKLVIAEKPSLAKSICDALMTQGESFTL